MLFNKIDFPNQIVDAIKNKTLVVFAGAGTSLDKPTSLSDFKKLTIEIAEDTGRVKGKEPCEVFLGTLKAQGIDVNKLAAEIILGKNPKHNKLHEAIVDLFITIDDIKIVTTNYDQMFEQAVESKGVKATVFNAPALPLGNDVEGIVHIHGNVDNHKYMVLTDEDFGKAYLTEGYASRFLVKLFESYTVLFVGYSYNDTIMRYLTRAIPLSRNCFRYILTDDKKSDWPVIGIQPVFYPKREYDVMRDGLSELGIFSKKGLIGWKTQNENLCDMPPKKVKEKKEIDYCLEDYERSLILAGRVKGKGWLKFLDQKTVFTECFSEGVEKSEKSDLWGLWLCRNFVGKDDSALLLLISKHKNIISKWFAEYLIQTILSEETIGIIDLKNYLLVLDNFLFDSQSITAFIEKLAMRGEYYFAFTLLKKLYNFNMLLENKYGITSDQVQFRHSFIGSYYDVNSAWKIVGQRAIEEFPYEVISFVIRKILELHQKYEIAGRASKDFEPLELALLEIEKGKGHVIADPLNVLSNMLLEASHSYKKQSKEFLRTTLLHKVCSDSVLLKKLILKTIRETQVFTEAEQIHILIDYNLLNASFCEEQVYLMAVKAFCKLSDEEKDFFIDAIEILNEVEDKESGNYKVYLWCLRLQKTDPSNERLEFIIKRILSEYDFQPPESLEPSSYSSSVDVLHFQGPVTEDELIRWPISKVTEKLNNYNEHSSDGPSRVGLLNTLSACLSKDIEWSKNLIKNLIEEKIDRKDIWQHVFWGIRDADYSFDDILYILKLIRDNIETIGDIKYASNYLLAVLKRNGIKEFFVENEPDFYSISEVIWNHRGTEIIRHKNVIDAAQDSIVGNVLFSWLFMVSLCNDNGIPEKYLKHFDEALELKSYERDIAIYILVGNFDFLCNRNRDWSEEKLAPYLIGKKTDYLNAWGGFIYFSRNFNHYTANIIAPIYIEAIKHIKWLDDVVKYNFVELFLTLLLYVIEKPTQMYILEFYKYASIEDRKLFIEILNRRLENMDYSAKIDCWNTWLKHFLVNRKKNKPKKLEEEENQAIMDLIIALPELFDDVVDVLCEGTIPKQLNGGFWCNLYRMHKAAEHSRSMAKLIIKLIGNDSTPTYGDGYIRKIAEELKDLEPKEQKALKEVLLKRNIDVDFIEQ